MVTAHKYPSQISTPPWVSPTHIPPLAFSTNLLSTGWIISMVESRTSAPADYCKLLATYAKWCYTIWRDLFPRTCVPTTASIKVVIAGQRQSFWVSTSLPHADLKEAARLVREQYMHALFGRLPEAPIFAEAVKRGGECGHVKWGHCAETLTTMWYVEPSLSSIYDIAITELV